MVSTRYRVLWIYAALQALTQFEWLRFAPLTSEVASRYGVSQGQVGLLSLVFPLVFVIMGVPCGALIDRIQVRTSLRIIAAGMLGAALLRVLDASYELLLSGQILFALMQPLVQSLIVRLADVWFPANERLRATEIASIALFAGIGLAYVLVPAIGAAALQFSLRIDAGLLGAIALLTFVGIPADPVTRAPAAILIEAVAHHAGREEAGTAISLFWLAGNGGGALAVWALSAAADSSRWDLGEAALIALLAVQGVVAYAGTSHLAARADSK